MSNSTRDCAEPSWPRLPGLADALHWVPMTAADPCRGQHFHEVPPTALRYFTKHVASTPWANHLALVMIVTAAQNVEPGTIYADVSTLHTGFLACFQVQNVTTRITTMEDWKPAIHLAQYVNGTAGGDTKATRLRFRTRYQANAKRVHQWLQSLSQAERDRYRPFLLPIANYNAVSTPGDTKANEERQKKQRKAETDALMPYYPQLRAFAHLRFNRYLRLYQAYQQALIKIANGATLPFEYRYTDEGVRMRFRVWDRRHFILNHRSKFSGWLVDRALAGKASFASSQGHNFLEYLPSSNHGDEPLWFAHLFTLDIVFNVKRRVEVQQWLARWGYKCNSFYAPTRNLLSGEYTNRLFEARRFAEGVLFPPEDVYAGLCFGLLALDILTTTGARLNELMQISLDKESLIRLVMPAPLGSRNPTPRVRYVLRLIPKGERKNQRHDYFIGEETKRLLVKVGQMLGQHYRLKPNEPLPNVDFAPSNRRAYRFDPAPYIFQYHHRALTGQCISACLRFLLHGLTLRTADNQPVMLRAHLLRHAFATYTVQVERIPVDIVGQWLHQKNLDVTDYYSAPTPTMVAESADAYLAKLAATIDVDAAVHRSPEELQMLYDQAQGKAGTFAEVLGGDCVSHGYCPSKFQCIGCPGKVPDPAKRSQIERKHHWALDEIPLAEAERLRQLVKDCNAELKEMDLIEEYRHDEIHTVNINR